MGGMEGIVGDVEGMAGVAAVEGCRRLLVGQAYGHQMLVAIEHAAGENGYVGVFRASAVRRSIIMHPQGKPMSIIAYVHAPKRINNCHCETP